MKRYFPILLSKPGELIALANLAGNVKEEIIPIIEVLNESVLDSDGLYIQKLQDSLTNIWSFDGNEIFLDFTFFDNIDNHIPKIRRLFNSLINGGVNAVPVVKFNNTPRYLNLIQGVIATHNCGLCIRTNNNSGGFLNYNADIAAMVARMNVNGNDTSLLIDLGHITGTTFNLMATLAFQTISTLHNVNNWKHVVVASGSFLPDLGSLPAPNTNRSPATVYRLQRYEWDIWTLLNGQQLPREIKYGDYGTKHPYFVPASFEGSCSIKYTTEHEYVIYRGRKASEHANAGGQYNISAASLISTADYLGQPYSWGDGEIYAIGNRTTKGGNAGKWVQISQNHHVTHLCQLL